MTIPGSSIELLNRLGTIRRLRPEFRFGQLVAIIGQLAEDETGRNLWDVEDEEFAAAAERFATDVSRRLQDSATLGISFGDDAPTIPTIAEHHE